MAKCVECNSVITEGEPFCGVCGLAVPKTAAPVPATPETEDPFEGTIVMAPNELAQAAGLNKPKSEPNVDPTQAGSTATEPTVEAESVIDPNAVPTPAILDKATSESLDVRSTADYKLEKGRTSESIDTGASEFVDFGLPRVEIRALIRPRQERAAPVGRVSHGQPGTHCHEAGQILVLAAQAVSQPRTVAGTR